LFNRIFGTIDAIVQHGFFAIVWRAIRIAQDAAEVSATVTDDDEASSDFGLMSGWACFVPCDFFTLHLHV